MPEPEEVEYEMLGVKLFRGWRALDERLRWSAYTGMIVGGLGGMLVGSLLLVALL